MDLNISTFSDLLRILDQRPEWRLRLRESLYPEADIPRALRELAEAQHRSEEMFQRLTTRDQAREREFEKFDERHRKSMEELDRIKEVVLDSIAREQARQEEREEWERQSKERWKQIEQALAEGAESDRKSKERLDDIQQTIKEVAEQAKQSEARIQQIQQIMKEGREESKARFEHIEQTMKETAEQASRRKEERSEWQRQSEARIQEIQQIMKEGREESKARFEHIEQTMKETAEQDKRWKEEREERDRQSEASFEHFQQIMKEQAKESKARFEYILDEFRQFKRDVTQQIGKLGGRWGIQNESIWRQTIATLIEDTYGDRVEEVWIEGDQFDVVITNGDHILVEITARFKSNDVAKVIRKRNLYTRHYQAPTRFIIAAASIHYRQANALINEGFELIEPEVE